MQIKIIILSLLFLFFGASPVFAVTVTISNPPSTITDQPFNMDVAVSGAQANTANYLRANLFPAGTTKYFGFTFNGSTFANSSDYSQYLPVNIDSSGSWTGTIQAKLDLDSSYYSGPGNYNLKVRRYTQSGSSYTWSNEITLVVDLPTPTPTPTPTPSPSPTPKPSPTPTPLSSSSASKTKTTNPTLSPTPKPSLTTLPSSQTPYPSKTPTKVAIKVASVAGASSSATPSSKIEVKNQKQVNYAIWIGSILVFAGATCLGYIYLKKR